MTLIFWSRLYAIRGRGGKISVVCEEGEVVIYYVFDLLVEWVDGESDWNVFVGIFF